MRRKLAHIPALVLMIATGIFSAASIPSIRAGSAHAEPVVERYAGANSSANNFAEGVLQSGSSVFRYPVVPGSTISGYFDHNQAYGMVTIFNGRRNSSGAGFNFSCTNPSMYDWVGCEDAVSGEASCSNSRELWYDGHHGIDFEYASNWHTGASCDPGRFSGITMPVYAPARGQVLMAGYDPNRPANGWHIRLKHDLNGNGNFNDDNFRSIYLHFTAYALAVGPGQIVEEGQYLGLGGSTGYSSSPHLHFEVQRSADYFQYSYWPVDPYGWMGQGGDPWLSANINLWRQQQVHYENITYLPQILYIEPQCPDCGEMLQNGGFENGNTAWTEEGVQVILGAGSPNLPVTPHTGSWLAWLAGRNNAVDNLYQDFTLPAGMNGGQLRYSLMVTTDEPGGAQDYLYVRLRKPDGTVLQELDFVDNTFAAKNQWVEREIQLIDLSAWQKQNLRISFKGTTSASHITNFYLDDVSLVTTAP